MERVAYVTGADRGLGRALTQALLDRGYHVYAGSHRPGWPELPALAAQHPQHLTILPLDVSNRASVQEAAARIREQHGHLDLLINNAAILTDRSGDIFQEQVEDDLLRLHRTNTLGPLFVTESVVDLLTRGTDRRLVFISSEAGQLHGQQRTREYGYAMSKAALNMLAVLLQNRLRPEGVKVLAFHPGYMKTYMLGHLNTEAHIEPEVAADGLLQQTFREHLLDGPIFMDYTGQLMDW
ncbi:SDR family oxidoreductase [Deinococcus sonorensis]|uniref:SDR family oxidoreductase n=2 Tax=Deinococcus sonorensis TaxID=309891 RepID=A0AAU7UAH4_9DEIO